MANQKASTVVRVRDDIAEELAQLCAEKPRKKTAMTSALIRYALAQLRAGREIDGVPHMR